MHAPTMWMIGAALSLTAQSILAMTVEGVARSILVLFTVPLAMAFLLACAFASLPEGAVAPRVHAPEAAGGGGPYRCSSPGIDEATMQRRRRGLPWSLAALLLGAVLGGATSLIASLVFVVPTRCALSPVMIALPPIEVSGITTGPRVLGPSDAERQRRSWHRAQHSADLTPR